MHFSQAFFCGVSASVSRKVRRARVLSFQRGRLAASFSVDSCVPDGVRPSMGTLTERRARGTMSCSSFLKLTRIGVPRRAL